MPIDPVSTGLFAGGSLLGAAGSFFGAQSDNRAARKQRDYLSDRLTEQGGRSINVLFGGNRFDTRSWRDGGFRPREGQVNPFEDPNDPGIFARLEGLGPAYQKRFGQQVIAPYKRDAYEQRGLAEGAEGIAAEYGRGAEALIDEDASRALTGANRMSSSALTARGLGGSSIVGNQIAGNTRDINREATRQKIDVRKENTDRRLNARSQRIGVLDQTGRGLATLRESMNNNRLGLDQQSTLFRANTLLGPIFNPYSASTNIPIAGASPGASALGSLGTSLSGFGGFMAGRAGSGQAQAGNNANMLQALASFYGQGTP